MTEYIYSIYNNKIYTYIFIIYSVSSLVLHKTLLLQIPKLKLLSLATSRLQGMPIKRNIINVPNTETLSGSAAPHQAPSSALFQLNSSATASAAINRTAALDSVWQEGKWGQAGSSVSAGV